MVRLATDSSYDDVPYEGGVVPGCHPERLATIARIFGVPAADPDACSVLEIGCAAGTNLLPIAYGLPRSSFVGIDPSERQIEMGRTFMAEYGITNTELYCLDVRETLEWDRKFDFILCHGVFSWVDDEVRGAILEAARRLLNPNGVAYISYNAQPGFSARESIREMLRFHANRFESPAERAEQARALLQFLVDATAHFNESDFAAYRQSLVDERELLSDLPASYIVHEHLTAHNRAFYFHEFLDLASAHHLQYLGDAAFNTMMLSDLPPEVGSGIAAASSTQMEVEQYRDFVVNRSFRKSLLCHETVHVQRNLSVDVFRPLLFRKSIGRSEEGRWLLPKVGGEVVEVTDPTVQAVLASAEEAAPRSLSFDELLHSVRARAGAEVDDAKLGSIILSLFALDGIDVRTWSPNVASTVGERPEVFPPARRVPARKRKLVPVPQHGFASLTPLVAAMIHLFDGQRTVPEIVDAIEEEKARGEFVVQGVDPAEVATREELMTLVPQALEQMLKVGLLLPAEAPSREAR
jgi:SAM-dependent methyltransferase/methyltransferase-like protein